MMNTNVATDVKQAQSERLQVQAKRKWTAATAEDLMNNEAKMQKTGVGDIVKYRTINGRVCARVLDEFKQGGVEMLLVVPVDFITENVVGTSTRIFKSAVVGDADSDEEPEKGPKKGLEQAQSRIKDLEAQLSVMRASTETYKKRYELLRKKLNNQGMHEKEITKYLDKEIDKYHKEIEKNL